MLAELEAASVGLEGFTYNAGVRRRPPAMLGHHCEIWARNGTVFWTLLLLRYGLRIVGKTRRGVFDVSTSADVMARWAGGANQES
jgi:hypothetical protein